MIPNLDMLVIKILIAFIDFGYSDNFDNTRQGGDKAMPTPMGSAAWWLLINSSSIPNFGLTNSSANATLNITTAPIWPYNITNPGDSISGGVPPSIIPMNSSSSAISYIGNETVTANISNFTSTNAGQTAFSNSTPAPTVSSIFLPNTSVVTTSTAGPIDTSTISSSTKDTRELPSDQYASSCRKYQDSELYNRLQDKGAYNQYFMANSPDEVGHLPGFKLADDSREYSDTHSEQFRRIQRSPLIDIDYGQLCTGRCKKISTIVRNALEDIETPMTTAVEKSLARDAHDNVWSNRTLDSSISSPSNVVAEMNESRKINRPLKVSLCRLETFIPIGQCDQRGQEEYTNLDRLCTACRGVYKLPPGCFPQFLNAITCNSTDIQCIFDVWSKNSHGVCQEKTITFTVMHNLGSEQCQEWRFESVDVPIACQCYLSKSSWLKA